MSRHGRCYNAPNYTSEVAELTTDGPPTRYAGLIGYPLGHSVSPALQQAAFDRHGLPVRYCAWETPPAALADRVAQLREARVLGANVTVPHKQAVIELLDEVDREAAFLGAVNTIVNRGGRLIGFNTDVGGFLRALREDLGCDPRGKAALLLGAGGAARAVAYALAREGARALTIVNRRAQRAENLARDMASTAAGTDIAAAAWEERALAGIAAGCDLIVNATTLGMWHGEAEGHSPLPAELIPSSASVFDLVYNPPDTPLLVEARRAGARAVNGLPMLVYQGADSFTLWTGLPAPVEEMAAAARSALAAYGAGRRA